MFPKHAHLAILFGATGCGKTEFVLDLLETEYKKFFEYIIIVCPTWMHNKAYLNVVFQGFGRYSDGLQLEPEVR